MIVQKDELSNPKQVACPEVNRSRCDPNALYCQIVYLKPQGHWLHL